MNSFLDRFPIMKSWKFQAAVILLAAAAWKIIFIFSDVFPFDSDEAVVALMARHILQGERPVFFYGQAYMGSLDAYLIAAGFWIFGQHIWVIRVVQMLLYLGTLFTTIWIGKEAFGSIQDGLLAAALLAVPTVNVTLYTTVTLGGYGEALLIGSLVLLIALKVVRHHVPAKKAPVPWALFLLWGALTGCGLWSNALSVVFSLPAGLYLLWGIFECRRNWLPATVLFCGAGLLAGASPWWIYGLTHGLDSVLLFGQVMEENTTWLARTGMHLVNFLLFGPTVIFGLRPPWSIKWLILPLLPFVGIFWVYVTIFFYKRLTSRCEARREYLLLGGVVGTLLAGFIFATFGADPTGRYFLPLAIPLALVAPQMIKNLNQKPWYRSWMPAAMMILVIGYQFLSTLQCAVQNPPGITAQFYEVVQVDHRADEDLIAFLKETGETSGYTSYWVAYTIAFKSQEELIFAPLLPYHLDLRYTPKDNRYPAYSEMASQSQRVAYITSKNPMLDEHILEYFQSCGVTWKEKQIGDYRVYYDLSRPIHPYEMGLGK